jgi:hypothetical protein
MKKLLFLSAMTIGFAFTSNAQSEPTTKAATQTATKSYKTIDRNTVSPTALEKIGTKYGGYSILEAYQAADGEYKLVVTKDNQKKTAYFTSAGDFLKEE